MVNCVINGKHMEVKEGTTILEAAKKAGYKIPTLCYRENLSMYGGCRLCIVEIKGRKNLPISCATDCEEGMEIFTHSDIVKKVRKDIFQLIIANHPFDCRLNCLTCIKNKSCELRTLAEEIGIKELKYDFIDKEWERDTTSLSIEVENTKCVACGRCVRTCREIQHVGVLTMAGRGPATRVTTFMGKGLGNVECTNCGQCIIACPTGAIHEVLHINRVIEALNDKTKHVVVQTAPAVRVTIGEEFGMAPGINVEKKLVSALKKIGFDKVFDTNFTADLTIVEEAAEFIERFTKGGKLPMITSCSPGWIKFAENNMPEILENISTCKSPQQMFGALSKSIYAEKAGIEPKSIVSVSVMPCTAKKYEMAREEMIYDGVHDVDCVLTTREIATLIKEYGIDLKNVEDSEYDAPFGISTGAAAIFGVSGGVMEAALRTAYELITGKELENLEFHDVRGLKGIKESEVEINGKVIYISVANGLENAYKLLQNKDKYHFIEIMTCPGGCIGGGGQPLSCDRDILEKRMKGIYAIDERKEIRKSHKNPLIIKLYEEYLEKPLSDRAHKLLHTNFRKK